MSRRRVAWLLLCACLALPVHASEDAAWAALRSGQAVFLMHHASAPGAGDPDSFRLGDCTTQRNLDGGGRYQAQQWGQLLRSHWIEAPRLFTGRWCRTQDTALELHMGASQPMAELDYFEGDTAAMQRMRQAINALPRGLPLVLVTHGANMAALTGTAAAPDEALIVALPLTEPARVLARIPAPH